MPLDGDVRAVGRITKDSSRLFEGTGEIVLADGSVAVEASGKYLRLPIERIAGQGFDESQWFADERARPDADRDLSIRQHGMTRLDRLEDEWILMEWGCAGRLVATTVSASWEGYSVT